VGDGNLRRADDVKNTTTFSGTSVLSPWDGDDTSVIDGKNHVGESHRSSCEFRASGDIVSFKGNINPVKVTASIRDVKGGRFSVISRGNDPVASRSLDSSSKGSTCTESLNGGTFLLLTSRTAIPASIAPSAETISPGKDGL